MSERPTRRPLRPIPDWTPAFRREVAELYRVGLAAEGEEAERVGQILPNRARRVGLLTRRLVAQLRRPT